MFKEFTYIFYRFVAERKHFPTGRMQLSCMAKIEDLWEDKTAQVTYGAGDVSRPNHLLISNSAGKYNQCFYKKFEIK